MGGFERADIEGLLETMEKNYFAEATFFADNRADLATVQVPSLIMQCSDDMIAPSVVGDYLSRELPGSTLRTLAATGHCPHMSHPDETIAVIREYLRLP